MNKKAVTENLTESEREELVWLRERNAYLEAEIAVIKNWEPGEKNWKLRSQDAKAAIIKEPR